MKKKLSLVAAIAALAATPVFAFNTPVDGDLMYNVYNTLVNGVIGQGVSYIIGFIGFLVAAYFLMQQKVVPGLFCVIGAAIVANIASITQTFGLLS